MPPDATSTRLIRRPAVADRGGTSTQTPAAGTGPSLREGSTLTEAQIVDAALSIIQRDGLDALTMRRLSRELGVSAMAAYYYVANKRELLDLVAARALADISVTDAPALAWYVRLRLLIDRIDAALRHYRGIGEVLLERMRSSQRHVMNAMMELLAEAGFDDDNIVMAYATVHTYLYGRYRVSMTEIIDHGGSSASMTSGRGDAGAAGHVAAEHVAAGHVAAEREDAEQDDMVKVVQAAVARLHGRDYYDFGVETVVAGLRAQLRVQRANQREAKRAGSVGGQRSAQSGHNVLLEDADLPHDSGKKGQS